MDETRKAMIDLYDYMPEENKPLQDKLYKHYKIK